MLTTTTTKNTEKNTVKNNKQTQQLWKIQHKKKKSTAQGM